jgi:hypothetical protein
MTDVKKGVLMAIKRNHLLVISLISFATGIVFYFAELGSNSLFSFCIGGLLLAIYFFKKWGT